ncbi:MAG: Cpe/LpqF family protein [Acidimicrobiales bacterium]
MRADTRTWVVASLVTVAALALAVWAVFAHAGTTRPHNDELDLLAGALDPDRSVVEDHLAWSLDVVNGPPASPDVVAERLSPAFLAELAPEEFIAETVRIAEARPYRFYGSQTDASTGTGAAMLVDRHGQILALTVAASPDDPTRIDGLLLSPVEIGRGPFTTGELAARTAAGLVVVVIAGVLLVVGRRRLAGWTAAAGLLCLAQLLEIADAPAAYTLGLIAMPFGLAAIAIASLIAGGPTGRRFDPAASAVAALTLIAAVIAVVPLTAIDTAAVSLPGQILAVAGDRGTARGLIATSGWVTAAAAGALLLFVLLRQFRADWTRDRGLVATTLGTGSAAVLVAVPALSAAIDLGHVDLSGSLLLPAATVVAATGIVGTAFWQRYDLGPVAAELEAENTQLQAELAEQLAEVQASRARIVHAGEEARRRIERDLHDGAQQRLVTLRLALQLGRDRFGRDDVDLAAFLGDLDRDLGAAVDELRELSRGIHPAILERGVVAAAQSLAETSPLPVTVTAAHEPRCGADVEHAAYFVISEALTNAARHACATHVEVTIGHGEGALAVAVTDDGVGGACPRDGAGLVNLEDRVRALGGRWRLASPSGGGTTIEVHLPCG